MFHYASFQMYSKLENIFLWNPNIYHLESNINILLSLFYYISIYLALYPPINIS